MPLPLPPDLAARRLTAGSHRRGKKLITFGYSGSGKSTLLASFPGRKFVLDFGERGLAHMLNPDEVLDVLDATHPDAYEKAMRLAIRHEDEIDSVLGDPINALWEEWMDYWSEKCGGEIKGGDWRKVKGPWKRLHWDAMRAKWNLGFAAHLKDIVYEEQEAAPGEKPKVKIAAQLSPAVEKSLPYLFDFILYAEQELDKKKFPTTWHRYTVYKARRPRSIPPADLHSGKYWRFNELAPENVWDKIIQPFADRWEEGATDHIGVLADPVGEEQEFSEIVAEANNADFGRVIGLIMGAESWTQYTQRFDKEIVPLLQGLPPDLVAKAKQAHERRVKELKGAGA